MKAILSAFNKNSEIPLYIILIFTTFASIFLTYYQTTHNINIIDTVNFNFMLTLVWLIMLVMGASQAENFILKKSFLITIFSLPAIYIAIQIFDTLTNKYQEYSYGFELIDLWSDNKKIISHEILESIHFLPYLTILIPISFLMLKKNRKDIPLVILLCSLHIYALRLLVFL